MFGEEVVLWGDDSGGIFGMNSDDTARIRKLSHAVEGDDESGGKKCHQMSSSARLSR